MMVRNEAKWLRGAIESAQTVADEVVLVDTGSTDGSGDIARSMGVKVVDAGPDVRPDMYVVDPELGPLLRFDAGRNAAIDLASCDWCLMWDADHRLSTPAQRVIKGFLASHGALELNAVRLPTFEAKSPGATPDEVCLGGQRAAPPWFPVCMFRRVLNGEVVRYHGIVHEDVTHFFNTRLNPGKYAQYFAIDAKIAHYGGHKSVRDERGSDARNSALLEARILEDPGDLEAYAYLIQWRFHRADYDIARNLLNAALAQPARPSHVGQFVRICILDAMVCLIESDWDRALSMANAASRHAPGEHPDHPMLRGLAYEGKGMLEDALREYDAALEAGKETWSSACVGGSGSWASMGRKAGVLRAMGRMDEAAECQRAFDAMRSVSPEVTDEASAVALETAQLAGIHTQ